MGKLCIDTAVSSLISIFKYDGFFYVITVDKITISAGTVLFIAAGIININ